MGGGESVSTPCLFCRVGCYLVYNLKLRLDVFFHTPETLLDNECLADLLRRVPRKPGERFLSSPPPPVSCMCVWCVVDT